jgi:putative endonuclease
MLPYAVYVLFSEKDFFLYVGYSGNLTVRKLQHDGGFVKSTKPRRPLKLIYCEYYLFKSDALRREKYFKTGMGRKALKLMLIGTMSSLGYKGSLKGLKVEYDEDNKID